MSERIYLDNAATSWPKPEMVYAAVDRYQREQGAPAGRGVYREAAEVERIIAETRQRLARLIGAESSRQIVFAFNGTDALNLALHGALRPGDHVVTTDAEHNSVLRPLRHLSETRDVDVSYVACDETGCVDANELEDAVRDNTRLIALIHVSNVTGSVQPVVEVGEIARRHGCLYLVDAAQSIGHQPLEVQQMQADFLAAPGHKGLFGPLGTGVLYLRPGIENEVVPLRQGGTGTQSDVDIQPSELPEKLEAGNLNVPGIVGLHAGLAFLDEIGISRVTEHERKLRRMLLEGFSNIEGISVHAPAADQGSAAVVSISIDGYDPREAANMLDTTFAVQVRAGMQCAPRLHQRMGTASQGGSIRFSPGWFSSPAQIQTAIQAVEEIAASVHGG